MQAIIRSKLKHNPYTDIQSCPYSNDLSVLSEPLRLYHGNIRNATSNVALGLHVKTKHSR